MHTSAETGGLAVAFVPVRRSQEPACHTESLAIWILSDTRANQNLETFPQIIFEIKALCSAVKLSTDSSDPRQPWKRGSITKQQLWEVKKKQKPTFIVIFMLSEISQVLHSQNRNSKINPTRKIYVAFLYIINIYLHTYSNKRKKKTRQEKSSSGYATSATWIQVL